ncbi:hypothetical protein PHLGIDRAFT_103916 [Phlebiopsis gigantea 11061_1 CR5-6]|uniref:tRNA-5-taurinomethyluridine 2-sulfurtransferase n=1 Tax=Phlebiopsis gigantea (strain 11061_1 CR5-6) TaxID=745531 RepID=A0A0C3SCD2_PHLG1|nr:hypothetical protein PHLGIDRAFT_103916 [Phlebiopsis gigantea 11061_1 CR5-6]
MSGGVDSSVIAGLLSREDYDLSAIFMRNWDTRDESGTDQGCEWKKDWADVQKVCKSLDIPVKMVDLSKDYWNRVFAPCLESWEAGVTPNPDVWCNKEVKFGALMKELATEDTWIATGHYANKGWSETEPYRPKLLRPLDHTKDQTYYLAAMPEKSLARTLFPLAKYTKVQVKEMAAKWDLPTASKPESMGLCFVGEKRRFDQFLSEYLRPRPGRIVNEETGQIISEHQGLWTLTVGQNARIPGMPEKMFVSRKDPTTNSIYVVPGASNFRLYRNGIVARGWTWLWADSPPPVDRPEGYRAQMQHRYRMDSIDCTIKSGPEPGTIRIEFDKPDKAITSGQVAVVWDGDWCLGCGYIAGTF